MKTLRMLAIAASALALNAINAFAAGTGLPIEVPLASIGGFMTGPFPYWGGGGMLAVSAIAWGASHGDLSDFGRRTVGVTAGCGMACLSLPMFGALFGATGGLI